METPTLISSTPVPKKVYKKGICFVCILNEIITCQNNQPHNKIALTIIF